MDDLCVEVRWIAGTRIGRTEVVDLSSAINKYRVYAPLRSDRKLFESLAAGNDGAILEWQEGDFDMAVTTVERLAEEQMTGADFEKFLARNNLTRAQAAAELGRSLRNIQDFIAKPEAVLPRVIALACFGYEARKNPWEVLFGFSLDATFEFVKQEPTVNDNGAEVTFHPAYRRA